MYFSLNPQIRESGKGELYKETPGSELTSSQENLILLKQNKSEDVLSKTCDLVSTSGDNLPLQDLSSIKNGAWSDEQAQLFAEKIPEIKTMFGSLLEQIWSGEWSSLRPTPFKDTLEIFHPQFRGAHQQDCQVQKRTALILKSISVIFCTDSHFFLENDTFYLFKEFLALLLDTLHEELRAEHAVELIDSKLEGGEEGNQETKDMCLASKTRGRKFSGTVGPTDDKR